MAAQINTEEVATALANILKTDCPHCDLQEGVDDAFSSCFTMLHPDGYHTDEESRQSIDWLLLDQMLLSLYRAASEAVKENQKLRNAVHFYRHKLTRLPPADDVPLPLYVEQDSASESNSGVNPVDSVGSA
jgi:hypothetical protein